MGKKILLVFLLCIINFALVAQTEAERNRISETYDLAYINKLKKDLSDAFLERERKIADFLNNNQLFSKSLKSGGKTYSIYDIVDGRPVYRTTHNVNSARATKTDKLQTGGSLGLNLDGSGMNIGVWDEESVRGTHDEFKDDQTIPESRVVYPEFLGPFFGPISDHATHVAGTLIGKGADSDAKGMAPKATLRSFDWLLDDQEALTEASNGLLISNHSYGVPIFNDSDSQQVSSADIGAYTSDARIWDEVAFAAPYYLAVNSAGNEGNKTYTGGLATGYDKLTGNKTSKNNLVVANVNPFVSVSGELINFPINSGSSQGPTDDFRIKPDIAADGTNVYSSISSSDSQYSTFSGTSMASPNVAGTLILLQEYYNRLNSNYMRAATAKGLVCHTALDDNSKVGPDPIFGWGLLNAEDAANTIKDASDGFAIIRELTLSNGDNYTYNFAASGSSKLKATICWTDPAGTSSSSPNNVLTPRLVNDLDLRLEDSNATTFTPWKLDNTNVTGPAIKGDNNVDNIERIDINVPATGQYTLTVTHKGTLVNGAQAFSLIITGADLTLSNPELKFKKVIIWPNPANDYINIQINSVSGLYEISLFDNNGRNVFQEKINTDGSNLEYAFNTKQFSRGVYFLKIKNKNSIHNQKIILK
ncbi:S8 family serine peptidase [Confluentibacter flavum]|uniref:Peptidase S8 n=1 Tax=Confluentibacter flavum TaxID=1909700 RepID=A0A2N3HF24_9FLAO|nr:S8 family serine peptidase [Confluentibacter flavum]PKQ43502.1 peptidase S8 [Confluentibacter flavum]